MMTWLSCIALSTSPLLTSGFTEIQDQSELPILSPDLKERQTAKIILTNGLEVLIVSDPMADQSAATIAVNAGSWSDPVEYPGMAHFCEHMLFMGTEKYPDSNEFSTQVSNFNGQTNAFTATDKTVYMFSCLEKGFPELLDRFAHFFIDPLFNPAFISREMHAVDQEFALMKENDGWREYMVFKETGNPNHPNRLFSAGNSKTLSKIPQSALKKWHRENYGSNRMRLAVYSSMPLNQLKELVTSSFTDIPQALKNLPDFSSQLTSNEQRGHFISIEPIKTCHKLSLSWELPLNLANDPSKSADLIAYTLERGQEHNLLQYLKKEHLVDDLRIQVSRHEGKDHAFFDIEMMLSDQGMQTVDTVILSIFQGIQGVSKSGIPESLFQEKNTLAKLYYQYQTRTNAFQYISQIGKAILNEDLATFPKNSILPSQYNPKAIEETFIALTPDQCIITLLAPQKETLEKKEQWLATPYSIKPISPELLGQLKVAKPHPDIRLPGPNPFVPKHLSTIPDIDLGKEPTKIVNSPFGTAFYVRCSEYQTPESAIYLHIASPEITSSAKSQVLSSLYLDHLTDQINPLISLSTHARLYPQFDLNKQRLHLTLTGFSEKMPLLLQEIVRQMPLNPPTQEQFNLYVSRHIKDYENSLKMMPVKQAQELLATLIDQDKKTKQEHLEALREISFEDFACFHKKLFEKTYFEALFAGNISVKSAESCWLDIVHALGQSPYPPSEHLTGKALHLPSEDGPFLIAKETSSQGNAAILMIDEGDFSLEKKAAQKILSAAIKEPFFDTLRTKQKTGYIAASSETEFEKRLYQYFLVQSNSHQPEDLLHRFELFLEEFQEDFANIVPESRFETLKTSAITTLQTQCRNIKDKSALWDVLAFSEKGDFRLIEKRIESLQNLSYEQFRIFSQESLSRSNRKRLAILYTGQIPAPFAYMPMLPSDLSKVATYEARPSH
jgi:insulysin